MHRILAILFGLAMLCGTPTFAETYYVAPLGAALPGAPDGSAAKPFASLEAAFNSGRIRGGDTLLLKSGHYGAVTIKARANFDSEVTVRSETGREAVFDSILLAQDTRNLTLQSLSVWPSDAEKGALFLVRAYKTTSHITIDDLWIRSEAQADRFMDWSFDHWERRKYSGILLEGQNSTASGNHLLGIYHGVSVMGEGGLISRNIVDGFNGDGMRANSNTLVTQNHVSNCIDTDDGNHDDGFQSWALASGVVSNLTLDGNTFIEWTGAPNHPMRCSLQGIGLFDGIYENLVITNNVVAVSHYHGISVFGARGARIVNNTVIQISGNPANRPWIMVTAHKNGTPSKNVLIANNLAMGFNGTADPVNGIEFRKNSVIGIPLAVFVDPVRFDYRLRPDSGLFGAADAATAPEYDIQGQKRTSGQAVDPGAYQGGVESPAPTPVQEPGQKPEPVPVTVPPKVQVPEVPSRSGQVGTAPARSVVVVTPTPQVITRSPTPAPRLPVVRQGLPSVGRN